MIGGVMTCVQRSDQRGEIERRWPGWVINVDSVGDLAGNFCQTLRLAKEAAESVGQKWILLAQDDVEPMPGLFENMQHLLDSAPSDAGVLAAFSANHVRDAKNMDRLGGQHWRKRNKSDLMWVLLMALRIDLFDDAIAFLEAHSSRHDDERLKDWMNKRKDVNAYIHVPSVVQHVGQVSATGKPWVMFNRERKSLTYGAMNIDQLVETWKR